MKHTYLIPGMALAAMLSVQVAHAETPSQILAGLETEARSVPGFQGFSSTRGEQFFKSTHGNDWSCSSCHTEDPANTGKHAKTSKVIQPLTPNVNAERFSNPSKVEKWFRRNCNDVLERACTAQEKGDVIAWLLTVKK